MSTAYVSDFGHHKVTALGVILRLPDSDRPISRPREASGLSPARCLAAAVGLSESIVPLQPGSEYAPYECRLRD